MNNVRVSLVHEHHVPGKRLGRHVEHDERSRAFASAPASGPLKSVVWQRHSPIFDQGDVGSCTGNAMAGAKTSGPLHCAGDPILTETDALKLYELATKLDNVPGAYPPDDTGSSGLAVAKAAKKLGMITSYHHAFGLTAALAALSRGPVIIGIDWYSGFDTPIGDEAKLVISGSIRGGHEVVVRKLDVENGIIGGDNSWSDQWGNKGSWVMTFATFGQLLRSDGDVVVPLR